MGSGSETLIRASLSDVYEDDDKQERHYAKYFGKKLGIFTAILTIPGALALIGFHVLLLKPVIINYIDDVDFFRRYTDFEISGIGIVAGVVSLIFVILTIKTGLRPTFAKVVLTFLAQGFCIALHLGVISFAILSPIRELRWARRRLLACDCADSEGNLERNGTNPSDSDCTTYDYRSGKYTPKKMEPCSLVDGRGEEVTEKFLICWIMVGISLIQSLISLVPFIMSIRTIWGVGDTFNKFSQACSTWGKNDEESSNVGQVCLSDGNIRTLRILGRTQLVIGLISAIVALSVDRWSCLIWQIMELYAIISYVTVNWLTTPGNYTSYTRITGVAFVHFLLGLLTLIPMILMSGVGFVMLLQMILYGIICTLLFGPLQKMAKIVTNTISDAVRKNSNESTISGNST